MHNSLVRAKATPAGHASQRVNHGAAEQTNDRGAGDASRRALDLPHLRRPFDGARVRTSSIARTSPRDRPGSRSPSTCRPRPASTAITSWRAARSARSASRSPTSATCGRCSTDIPLASMNTSMTINATAPWLMALYIAVADEQGAPREGASGHDPERHHQGISGPRILRLPARSLAPADQRHDPVRRAGRRRSGTR